MLVWCGDLPGVGMVWGPTWCWCGAVQGRGPGSRTWPRPPDPAGGAGTLRGAATPPPGCSAQCEPEQRGGGARLREHLGVRMGEEERGDIR